MHLIKNLFDKILTLQIIKLVSIIISEDISTFFQCFSYLNLIKTNLQKHIRQCWENWKSILMPAMTETTTCTQELQVCPSLLT